MGDGVYVFALPTYGEFGEERARECVCRANGYGASRRTTLGGERQAIANRGERANAVMKGGGGPGNAATESG